MSAVLSRSEVDTLYRAHGHVVLRRARTILGSESEAQEILQEVFMSLLQHSRPFAADTCMTSYLYRATTNRCLNRFRDARRRQAILAENPGTTTYRETNEERLDAQQLLARLPEKLAQLAVYYYVDEMSQEEISTVLGCSRRMVGKLVDKLHAHVHGQGRVA